MAKTETIEYKISQTITYESHQEKTCLQHFRPGRNQVHYENMPMLYMYTGIFQGCKNDNFQVKNCDVFLIFAQNIECGYTLEPPLTSTHNLCFRAKIRKNVYPCKPHFYYIKVGCTGVFMSQTCFCDEADCPQSQARCLKFRI